MVDKFYAIHKNELDKYDAFICCYPPIFLKLFEKFNKPIIVVAATRYDYPVLNDNYRLLWLEDSLINNKNVIRIANNEFDKKYCEFFTKVDWEHIPSLCDYTGVSYNPTKSQGVAFCKFTIPESPMVRQQDLGKYSWEQLYSFTHIVHFPYNVSTMSIFEQSRAGIPLLFPSLKFSLELLGRKVPIFSEITFPSAVWERQPCHFLNEKWLKLSDFYNGVIEANYFDSLEGATKIKNLSSSKIKYNKNEIYLKWERIILGIS